MPRVLKIGNVHPSATLLSRITFPVIDWISAIDWIGEALQTAVEHRSGVVTVGDKGTGKSLALEHVVADFRRGETLRCQNSDHVARAVVIVSPGRAETRSEMIRSLYCDEMGELPQRISKGGDVAIFKDLIEAWLDRNVAAVCFDEAETLSKAALDVCRDIISHAASRAGKLTEDGSRHRAAGIGVVLIGTDDLVKRLRRGKGSGEYGERWGRTLIVDRLPAEDVPLVYREYLPAFAAEADRIGQEAWAEMISAEVTPHLRGSVRRIETHVRTYATRYVNNAETPPSEIEEIEFDRELFLNALHEIVMTESIEFEAA